ncbi:fructose-bisphosphate aldolase-lysine N-methyltransferase, chloroplastic isoform X7 [Citrus sinensis]|uniref:fructose-bisphosphate aldolase-lysine N-methyltransferase, chloroplastic isoform X5 n=1 Tax=Citrus clementina TaxID=85681 RepID=UPI000CECFFEF|nr:fructose-bisphosphate aldolase-lysine N-methyltransferase, chloroplastic isoform X5 [Citrus x clementina]XP_052295391.1 fructose-bisphosphate aldolase-lysine N-methyltransferase, chloroplastic isoform X7 [Citrus sinensis]
MLVGARLTGAWCFRHRRPHCAKAKLTFSSSSESKVLHSIDDEYDGDFLPWLERKAGVEILSVLSIGKSVYGRSLFASEKLRTGDCILKVPYAAQLTPDNLHPKIKSLLDDEISNVAKLAIVILFEQKMGKDSEWAPYISRLPQLEEMHNTIFWSKDELDLICPSSLFEETVTKKDQIESEFLALECFPEVFDHIKLKDFMHAYALDFLNHDGLSEAVVLHDEDKQLSEVIADRDYAPKEEVWITYGKFSNSTLLLDFGFSLPYNSHDEVQIQIKVPDHDPLLEVKLEVLQSHCLPRARDVNGFKSSNDSFTIKEVRSARGRGKGLPQSLRAFARVLCCTSPQELCDLATEAAQNDGRLARRPFRNSCQEILAHQILLSHIIQLTKEYSASIELLEPVTSPSICKRLAFRKQMARDLLIGELRILKSASAWLENYCATLA